MEKRIANSSIVRVAGNLLSGVPLTDDEAERKTLARRAVALARAIAAEVERTEPETEMTDADRAGIDGIMDPTLSDRERVRRITAYWNNDETHQRTPRKYLMMHCGILSGIVDRLLNAGAGRPVH